MLRPHDHRPEIVADLTAILAEPSLYQEAILLLGRRGLDVGEAAQRAAAAEPHVECEALISAWAEVYRDPAHHWDLYELAEKLIDFEDYLRRWRFNHVTTVERIIGLKRGTGGTSGSPATSSACWRSNSFRNSGGCVRAECERNPRDDRLHLLTWLCANPALPA